jgi:hypothetical protein
MGSAFIALTAPPVEHLLAIHTGELLTSEEAFNEILHHVTSPLFSWMHHKSSFVNVVAPTRPACTITKDVGTVSTSSFTCRTIDFALGTTSTHDYPMSNLIMVVPF